MTRADALKYRDKVEQGEQIQAIGGIKEEVSQSDKIGYNWHRYYINDVLVRSDYEEQENPIGTSDNPFIWESGMELIPNGYYSYNGKRYVAIKQGNPTKITDEYFVEF